MRQHPFFVRAASLFVYFHQTIAQTCHYLQRAIVNMC